MNQLTAHSPYRVLGVAVNEVTPVQGRLGAHTVQALPAARTGLPSLRQISHSIGAGFRRLADRLVALVSPERSRYAQAQVRDGLQATDAAVNSLVSAIKSAGDNAASARSVRERLATVLQQAERTCRRAARPLEARDALVCARLAIVLGQQDLRTLQTLSESLQVPPGTQAPTIQGLQMVRDALATALQAATREAITVARAGVRSQVDTLLVAQAAALVDDDLRPEQAMALMNDLCLQAANCLAEQGLPVDLATRRAFVMDAIHARLGDATNEAVMRPCRELFRRLPGFEQRDLRAACQPRAGFALEFHQALDLLEEQMDVRHRDLATSFQQAVEEVAATDGVAPDACARHALSALTGLDALIDHERSLGLANANPGFGAVSREALQEDLFQRIGHLQPGALDDRELGALRLALGRLGQRSENVEREVERREARASQRHHEALRAMTAAWLEGGGDAEALAALHTASRAGEEALRLRQTLGERVPLEQHAAFRRALVQAAVSGWNPATCEQVRANLASRDVAGVLAALHGSFQPAGDQPGRDQPAPRCAELLEDLCAALSVDFHAPSAGEPPAAAEPALVAAIRATFGATTRVTPAQFGQLAGKPLDEVNEFVASLTGDGVSDLSESHVDPLVCKGLAKDMIRANFLLDTGTGHGSTVVSSPMIPGEAHDRIRRAVGVLHEASGRDDRSLRQLSEYIFQRVLLPVETSQLAAPCRLRRARDGEPAITETVQVKLIPSSENLAYLVEPHPEGGWSVRITHQASASSYLEMVEGGGFGHAVDLNPDRNRRRFEMTLRVTPEGVARLAGPVRYAYAVDSRLDVPAAP